MDDYICLSSLTIRRLLVALIIEFEDITANSISLESHRIEFLIINLMSRLIEKSLIAQNVTTAQTGQG
jgi:hypothetical protein